MTRSRERTERQEGGGGPTTERARTWTVEERDETDREARGVLGPWRASVDPGGIRASGHNRRLLLVLQPLIGESDSNTIQQWVHRLHNTIERSLWADRRTGASGWMTYKSLWCAMSGDLISDKETIEMLHNIYQNTM